MRASLPLVSLAAGLAAAQSSVTVVITEGVTTTYALPPWPTTAGSESATSTPTQLSIVTLTVSGEKTSGTTAAPTTLTVVPSALPSGSTWGPGPFGQSSSYTYSKASGTVSSPATVTTGTANGTAPTTVPTAGAASLELSKAGLLVFFTLGLLLI